MKRRDFLKAAAAGATAACLPGTLQAQQPRAQRPNVILIMVDDMGYSDLGCYGGEIHTPNVDRLAREGLRFSQFYNNAKCGPTRASLLTGLYAHQVGCHTGVNRMQHCVTLGEAMQLAGYRTLMSGKWHADELPVNRGFDRYYGLTDGCCNFWNPGVQREGEPPPGQKRSTRKWAIEDRVYHPYTPEDRNFYTTDAFTTRALGYLDEWNADHKDDEPFFLYLAYTAPHYPLHAWPEDIARYRGKYMQGWDKLREERYKRQLEMGLFRKPWEMSPRNPGVPKWEDARNKDEWDLKMAVYAAMIDRMDQNVGRLLNRLEEIGAEDNTLIMFLSDNGACAEVVHRTPDIPPGPVESYRSVDPPWANASNTPFRKYKSWDHEGGVATPFIAWWPGRIEGGGVTHQPGHIIDIMATMVDVSGTKYPEAYKGRGVLPLEGKTLSPIFDGKEREGHEALFWEFAGSRAVRKGRWKLVAHGGDRWELYDMDNDRTELKDLAKAKPDLVRELEVLWKEWRQRAAHDLEHGPA